MHRRHFLTRLANATGLALAARALPVSAMEGMKPMHEMSGMGHMDGMEGTHDVGSMEASSRAGLSLASHDAIPAGRPFAAPIALRNETTEPGKFKARLVAAPTRIALIPGVTTEAWTYNGHMPGPLMELRAGDVVEITLENRLGQPTTIHWHGLPVPPDQDGNPADAVAPGNSRVYRFKLPDTVEGLYWYHPHPHGLSGEQVYRGLAGPIIVRPGNDTLAAIPERILVITDLRLTTGGQIPGNDMMDWMNGREGQFALVNGLNRPTLPFHAGGRERWYILNATNARYLRLALPGHRLSLLGTDGGRIDCVRPGLQEILLAPAQRVELLVTAAGRHPARLLAETYERGKMGGAAATPAVDLMQVDFGAVAHDVGGSLPQSLREFPDLPPVAAHKRVVMSESMPMGMVAAGHGAPMAAGHSGMEFLLNDKVFDMHRVDLSSRAGAWEDWLIVNDSDMDHPFHVHGTQFAVMGRERHGKKYKEPFRAWYDTVNLKPGETVHIRIMQSRKGMRMFHCHILEHEDLGMMGRLEVT